jgi:hypothetical protein
MHRLLAPIALCAAALAVGCANSSVVGGVPDAAADVPVTDISSGIDASALDAPAVDVIDVTAPDIVDAPPGDLGPTPCTRSEQCVGDPGGPACDTARGRCVPCTDAEDRCPTGQYCVPMMQSCQPGCRDDNACATASGDGGMTQRRCDLSSRQCVACVIDEHCPAGNLCVGNLCVAGCSSVRACPTGQTCCMGGCVDTQSNTASCGACGARCTVLNATAVCLNGQCGYSACTAPFGDCDRDVLNGCESNLLNDTSHCGACGTACGNRANASARCEAGTCRYTCNAGFEDCDGDASNGCETDTRTTATACGACGNRCALANAESTCVDGRCAVGRCAANFGDCDGNALNGCEADLRTSVAHCGFCNTSCPGAPNAVPACAQGTCAITCTAGFADCDGRLDNGCEADTRVSATHCGGCGRACAPANGTGACSASTCALTGCSAGFADCDGNLANGCEVNTRSDVANCGVCSTRCTVPSGTAACVAGACRVDACTAPFGDCDGNVGNGCETNTSSSVAHCGACGSACAPRANSAASCLGSACRYTCNAGFADCDGNASNGCEVNLASDLAHCGTCNNRCASANTTSACTAGACAVQSCAGTFRNCDGAASNGCEANIATSTAHCGACNSACPARANAATTCAGGACGFTCNAGFNDCDDDAANGCETAGACVYASCNAVPRTRPSGVYALRTGGVLWDAYCDMTSDGGGWTLVLKVDGNASTFNYDSGLWTNTTLLNPTNTNLAQTEAKFQGFVNQSFTALRLAFVDGATRGLVVTTTGTSLRDVFAGGSRATSAGRNGWRSLFASPSQQPFCNSEGFNVGVGGYRRVRLGMVTNQENECTSPDSCVGIGFGSDSNTCVTPTFAGATAGNIATCGGDNGDRNTRVFAYVFVR